MKAPANQALQADGASHRRKAGVKKATFGRELIRDQPYVTAADVLPDMEKHWGDKRLRVRSK